MTVTYSQIIPIAMFCLVLVSCGTRTDGEVEQSVGFVSGAGSLSSDPSITLLSDNSGLYVESVASSSVAPSQASTIAESTVPTQSTNPNTQNTNPDESEQSAESTQTTDTETQTVSSAQSDGSILGLWNMSENIGTPEEKTIYGSITPLSETELTIIQYIDQQSYQGDGRNCFTKGSPNTLESFGGSSYFVYGFVHNVILGTDGYLEFSHEEANGDLVEQRFAPVIGLTVEDIPNC